MKSLFSLLLLIVSFQTYATIETLGSRGGYIALIESSDVQNHSWAHTPIGEVKMEGVFSSVMFHRAEISKFECVQCDLDNADFSFSSLLRAQFEGTIFRETILKGADLRGSKFDGCEFQLADLSYTDLRGVDFGSSLVGNSLLFGALFSSKTKLPFAHDEALARGMIYTGQ
jgi:uncharacterized protein YjbI with pentapeptide repeats